MTTNAAPIFSGELARRAGVGKETIRYYERRRLLPQPRKRESGYREYPPEAVDRIRFIRHAQALGFTLREIAELLYLNDAPDAECGEVLEMAMSKLEEVRSRIRRLQMFEGVLDRLARQCRAERPLRECPVIAGIFAEDPAEVVARVRTRAAGGGQSQTPTMDSRKGRRR
jgi:Hg(II)-responsive transcriptional regulator